MKYTLCYTKTFSVEVDADSVDNAVEIWEDLDLDAIEDKGTSAELMHVEWHDENGAPHSIYY